MNFSRETKVKDIALANPAARQVLEEAGLDYCCGGGSSLRDACHQADIAEDDILKRLRESAQNACAEEGNWMTAPLRELTRHIREKHHNYVREAIPRTQKLLDKVVAKHGGSHRELSEIRATFIEVAEEMILHMQKEEQILFPYIEALEQAAGGTGSVEPPFFQTVQNPIRMMTKEHDDVGALVRQIRRVSGEYQAPADACASFKALYEGLKEFEADLHQHVHLENNILFPRAVEMEATAA